MNVATEVEHLVSSSTVRVPFLESLEAPILQCRFKYVNCKIINLGSDTFGNPIFQKGLQN